jgi:hypothetical protein
VSGRSSSSRCHAVRSCTEIPRRCVVPTERWVCSQVVVGEQKTSPCVTRPRRRESGRTSSSNLRVDRVVQRLRDLGNEEIRERQPRIVKVPTYTPQVVRAYSIFCVARLLRTRDDEKHTNQHTQTTSASVTRRRDRSSIPRHQAAPRTVGSTRPPSTTTTPSPTTPTPRRRRRRRCRDDNATN